MRTFGSVLLLLALAPGCSGPTAHPTDDEFASPRQRTVWSALERNAVETPPGLVGYWRAQYGQTVMELELSPDGTYRRGPERSFRPHPDQEWRSGYEAGAYRVVADGTIVFNAQSGADGFSGAKVFHRVYRRTYTLDGNRLDLGEADYLGTKRGVPLHPFKASFERVLLVK